MKRLEGKVAVLTGASKGLGRGVARAFAKEGAALAICARGAGPLQAAADDLRGLGAEVLALPVDLTDADSRTRFIERTIQEFGTIDVLANNACTIPPRMPFEDIAVGGELWNLPMQSGLEATAHLMQLSLPHMKDTGGKIINFTAMAGSRGRVGAAPYAASKGAILSLSRVAAIEWGHYGIQVNCICPSAMSDTWQAYLDSMSPQDREKYKGNPAAAIGVRLPAVGYVGDPEADVGPVAVFLASSDSDYITGAVLPADGGEMELETTGTPRSRG